MGSMEADEVWEEVAEALMSALQSYRNACSRVWNPSGNTEYSDGLSLLRYLDDGTSMLQVFSDTLPRISSSKDSQSVEHSEVAR